MESPTRIKRWLGLALACGAIGCSSSEAGQPAAVRAGPRETRVEVVVASSQTFDEGIEVSANVLPLKQVKIIPRVPGRLHKLLADEGDQVEEGQVVARLEQRDFRLAVQQARAAVAAAGSGVELATIGVRSAETTVGRMKALRESEAITQAEMDKVRDGQDMGLAKMSAAQSQVQLAKVGLAAAQAKLADTVMRAPFDGLVLKRLLDEGEICGMMPPAVIMVIAQVDPVKVEGSVGERERRLVKAGMPATVRIDGLPGKTFTGTVEDVSPMVDPVTRTAKVRVHLPNPDAELEVGMSAQLVLELGEREVVVVPDEAIVRTGAAERSALFVVEGNETARRREVALGARQGGLVEVREGLEAGERVIRSGQTGMSDGAPVVISRGARERSE